MILSNYLKKLLIKIKKSVFWKEVAILSSGSGISQLIYILSLPIISRLFGVEEFGNLGLFQATIGIWTVIISLRLCGAIPIPKSKEKADNLFWTSVIITLFISFVFFIIAFFTLTDNTTVWVAMLFIVLIAQSFLEIFEYYLLRVSKISIISKQLLLRVVLIVTCQLLMFFYNHENRLVIGYVLGITIHIIIFSIVFFKTCRPLFNGLKVIKTTIIDFKEFVLFQTPTVLFNSLISNLPFLIVNHFYGKEVLGLYTMANKILLQPFQLIGTSLRRSFLKNAAMISDKNERRNFLYGITSKLNKTALPLLLLFVLISPLIIPTILGENWKGIDAFMLILFFSVYTGLINQTVQAKVEIESLQKKYLYFTLFSQFLLLAVMLISGSTINTYLIFFIIISSVTGVVNLIKYSYFSKI